MSQSACLASQRALRVNGPSQRPEWIPGRESLQTRNLDVFNESSPDPLDTNRNRSDIEAIEPLPTQVVWNALNLRYNNQGYHFLQAWDLNNQPFRDFVCGIVKPIADPSYEMNTYLGEI